MHISFIAPDDCGIGNITGSGIYCPYTNLQIAKRLLGLQNILRAELNAILVAVSITKHYRTTSTSSHIASIIDLLNKQPHTTPSSQHHHIDKLFVAAIVNHIKWSLHKITKQKVSAHTCIIGNELVDQLVNDKTTLILTQTHTAHPNST